MQEIPARAVKRSLRVAMVVEAAGGGVAVHVADLIKGLVARGVEVHAIVPFGERLDEEILVEQVARACASFVQVPMQRGVSWRDAIAFFHVLRHLARIRPDVVHSHSSKAGVLARLCIGSWRQVYTPHAFYTLNPGLRRVQRRFFGFIERMLGSLRTDRVIAVSDDEARHARIDLSIPERLTSTIHNGVSPFPMFSRKEAREALGLDADAFYAGFVGRLEFQKGADRLKDVARLLEGRFGDRVSIAVIGSGALEADIRHACRHLANVRLLGKVDSARRYFAAFDVFVLPSRYEGFPYVYLEAMWAGLPIVTTRVAGADEFVGAGEIGMVVDNDDHPGQLAHAIGTLFENPSARDRIRERCGIAARRFSTNEMVMQTLQVYQQVTKDQDK